MHQLGLVITSYVLFTLILEVSVIILHHSNCHGDHLASSIMSVCVYLWILDQSSKSIYTLINVDPTLGKLPWYVKSHTGEGGGRIRASNPPGDLRKWC